MWPKAYRDYQKDGPLVKEEVEPGNGIVGCEMHDLNGWGEEHHVHPKPKTKGVLETFFTMLFGYLKEE